MLCILSFCQWNRARLEILSLIEEEEEELVLEDEGMRTEVQSFDLYSVGRFLTYRGINFNAMRNKVEVYMCIRDLNSGHYLFQFFHQVVMKKVLAGVRYGLLTAISCYSTSSKKVR